MAKRRRQLPESGSLTSSTPQKLPKKQKAMFREVLLLLEENAIPFAVAGAARGLLAQRRAVRALSSFDAFRLVWLYSQSSHLA